MKLIQYFMANNPCYNTNTKIKVQGLMLHSVGCSQPNASVFIKNWNKATHKNSCVHGFIDGITGVAYQTLPWDHRGWHAGGSANNTHIGIEMCEPASIKYKNNSSYFVIIDRDNAVEVATRTYNTAVELFAELCNKFSLNPLKSGVIISHSEGHKNGVASNHADPEHLWKQLKLPYTMNTFRNDIANKIKIETIYRVQVGAFRNKTNAENYAQKLKKMGIDCFITKG